MYQSFLLGRIPVAMSILISPFDAFSIFVISALKHQMYLLRHSCSPCFTLVMLVFGMISLKASRPYFGSVVPSYGVICGSLKLGGSGSTSISLYKGHSSSTSSSSFESPFVVTIILRRRYSISTSNSFIFPLIVPQRLAGATLTLFVVFIGGPLIKRLKPYRAGGDEQCSGDGCFDDQLASSTGFLHACKPSQNACMDYFMQPYRDASMHAYACLIEMVACMLFCDACMHAFLGCFLTFFVEMLACILVKMLAHMLCQDACTHACRDACMQALLRRLQDWLLILTLHSSS
uniref:Uncharacterized protein n=1 Tax=Cannabis sativa TaxID=3483 RepID=A0A803Q7Z6_CANSA